jgi:hypothetical protein
MPQSPNKTMNRISRSDTESEVYGLELFRGKVEDTSQLDGFLEELIQKGVDVCRLKVNANDKNAFAYLTEFGIPYQLYNMLYTNYVEIATLPEEVFTWPKEYSFRPFHPEEKDLMTKMTRSTIDRKTWVNYNSDLVADQITNDRELLASQEYACSFYSEGGSKASWIISFDGKDIGYFMGEESEDGFYGTFYGIRPEHRNKAHSKVVYMMMLSVCRERGYRFFKNDIGIMNIPSQKSASSQRMVPTDIYFHFELYPFLSGNWGGGVLPDDRILRSVSNIGLTKFEDSITKFIAVNNAKVTLEVVKFSDETGRIKRLEYHTFR